ECLNLGEEDAGRLAGGGGTQRLRAPRLDLRGARILEGILQPVCAGTPGAHERKEPVQVGMLEPQYHPTGLTLATGAVRVRLQAEQELTEPEGQPLLAHAGRPMDEQRRRQLARLERAQQALPGV